MVYAYNPSAGEAETEVLVLAGIQSSQISKF